MSTTVARFVVHGDWFTDFMRDLVQEGKWQRAVEAMKEDLHGINYDQIVSVLDGSMMFAGDSNVGLDLVPETRDITSYRDQLAFMYNGIFKTPGNYIFYKIHSIVDNWGPNDVLSMGQPSKCKDIDDFAVARSLHYKKTDKDICEILKHPITKHRVCVLSSPCEPPPMWMKFPFKAQEAFDAMKRTKDGKHVKWLKTTGHQQEYGEDYGLNMNPENLDAEAPPLRAMAQLLGDVQKRENEVEEDDRPDYQKKFDDYCENNPVTKRLLTPTQEEMDAEEEFERAKQTKFDQQLETYATEIRRRADELESQEIGKGWLIFTHEVRDGKKGHKEMTLRVPRLPFLWWALRRTGMAKTVVEEYTPVSYSGIKMYNDDPYHTDWLLGGGYPLFDDHFNEEALYKKVMDCAYSEYFRVQEEYLSFSVAVLCGEGYASGHPEFPGKGERCKGKDAIAIIPNAGPDYLEAALSAKAVIVESGGSMAHLVTVLRPQGVIIVREENAIEKYKWAPHISISTSQGKITVMA